MIRGLNLRHLRAAVEIGRRGSISAAAEAVHLTQPAVTQALARLEAQLGWPLFERRHNGMVPLPAATLFLPRAAAALDHVGNPRVTMAQLRALIALADEGGYAAAARAAGLSQPTLHRAVRDLSIVVQRALVERRGRGVALTRQGRLLARGFRIARGELRAGLAELEGLAGRDTGLLVIGAMPLARARLLPAAISRFCAEFPQMQVRVVAGAFHELIEPLRGGGLDLMIGALRDPGPGSDLKQTPLFEDRPAVILRAGHPLLAERRRGPAALARYPWVLPPRGTPLRDRWHAMFDTAGIAAPPVPIECGSPMLIRRLLLDGNLITLLSPDQLALEIEAGLLAALPAPAGLPARTIGMTVRSGWRPTAPQRGFIDLLALEARALNTETL